MDCLPKLNDYLEFKEIKTVPGILKLIEMSISLIVFTFAFESIYVNSNRAFWACSVAAVSFIYSFFMSLLYVLRCRRRFRYMLCRCCDPKIVEGGFSLLMTVFHVSSFTLCAISSFQYYPHSYNFGFAAYFGAVTVLMYFADAIDAYDAHKKMASLLISESEYLENEEDIVMTPA